MNMLLTAESSFGSRTYHSPSPRPSAVATLSWLEAGRPGRLGILARPRTGEWLELEMKGLRDAGVDVLVSLLTRDEEQELNLRDERRCAEEAGMTFASFPIDDRKTPGSRNDALELICELSRLVADGKSVAIHCRMGVGRSSMIAASVLVVLGIEGDRAFELLAAARGLSIPETDEQREWVLSLEFPELASRF